jgi:CubicO group peptidase (beta-lactamase class C family)
MRNNFLYIIQIQQTMKYLGLLAFIILNLVACTKEQDKSEGIKKVFEEFASEKLFNGSLIVANADSVFFKASYGYANIETKDSICSSTPFPIASLTKQFTATAILLLQETGKLSLEDKIDNYIEIPDYMQSVSIRNLMNHTSGIPDYWQNSIENNNDSIYNYLYKQDSLLFHSNTSHSYSNSGYFLLGKIIEAISDTTYSGFLQERIFKPIGMKNTFVYNGMDAYKATGYNLKWVKNEYLATTADGGIISTIDDLQLWDKSLSGNKILKSATRNLMFQPTELADGTIKNTGFGWEIGVSKVSLFDHLSGKYKGVISHTGGLSSFAAYNQYDTRNGLYIILLSNQLRPELKDLINRINKQVY